MFEENGEGKYNAGGSSMTSYEDQSRNEYTPRNKHHLDQIRS